MQGDIAREDLTQFLCRKLAVKIRKYPEAAKALKELGREMLDELPACSKWTREFYELFRE